MLPDQSKEEVKRVRKKESTQKEKKHVSKPYSSCFNSLSRRDVCVHYAYTRRHYNNLYSIGKMSERIRRNSNVACIVLTQPYSTNILNSLNSKFKRAYSVNWLHQLLLELFSCLNWRRFWGIILICWGWLLVGDQRGIAGQNFVDLLKSYCPGGYLSNVIVGGHDKGVHVFGGVCRDWRICSQELPSSRDSKVQGHRLLFNSNRSAQRDECFVRCGLPMYIGWIQTQNRCSGYHLKLPAQKGALVGQQTLLNGC